MCEPAIHVLRSVFTGLVQQNAFASIATLREFLLFLLLSWFVCLFVLFDCLFVCFLLCFVFVLFCFVLFCFVLCFVLFCLFVLFCFVLFCFVLFCFVLFCFVLFCFVLFCFVLVLVLVLVFFDVSVNNWYHVSDLTLSKDYEILSALCFTRTNKTTTDNEVCMIFYMF